MSTEVAGPIGMELSRVTELSGRRSVRRVLFGPVDHDKTRSILDRELAKIDREQQHRWNFDFKKERPLQGRYQWSRVDSENVQVTLRVTSVAPTPLSDVSSRKQTSGDQNQAKITGR
ncbi:cyclin-dependent kinase inhibitor 1C-like [Centruroides sculpturatus]|uniref:cyclin-dependent kinase inhibitor 1C-like n=1 Tax=Centruroides sculpturatus TaxID=218467 RepID=UPI000C6D8BAC|nr:cyclin-dependent kinase inhibitor 1C-like [Centruroides sculpturatus]XP_023238975.1 cyclin-dependent kinase inhibitor 1C-like [Centruroides sculpturatus]